MDPAVCVLVLKCRTQPVRAGGVSLLRGGPSVSRQFLAPALYILKTTEVCIHQSPGLVGRPSESRDRRWTLAKAGTLGSLGVLGWRWAPSFLLVPAVHGDVILHPGPAAGQCELTNSFSCSCPSS